MQLTSIAFTQHKQFLAPPRLLHKYPRQTNKERVANQLVLQLTMTKNCIIGMNNGLPNIRHACSIMNVTALASN